MKGSSRFNVSLAGIVGFVGIAVALGLFMLAAWSSTMDQPAKFVVTGIIVAVGTIALAIFIDDIT